MHMAVVNFQKSIKRDKSNYLELTSDDQWEPYHRRLIIQSQAEDVWQILHPKPANMTPEEERLDQAKSTYMFSVFEHTLKISKGKSIVRKYMDTFDARKVYMELKAVMIGSAKGDSSRKKLLHFLVTARYGKNVTRCSAEHFVILFREKFRLLDELHVKTSRGFDDESRIMLLQSAVEAIEELDRVRTDKRLLNKPDMTFDEYADLVELAAIDYDEKFRENRVNRVAYFTEMGAQDDPTYSIPEDMLTQEYLDPAPPSSNIQVYNTQQKKIPVGNKKPTVGNSFKPPPSSPYEPKPGELASKVWQALSPAVKQAISDARNKVRTVNLCDVEEMDPDHDTSSTPQEEPIEDDNPLLEYLCGNVDDPSYGDIREVLATKRSKPPPNKKRIPPESHNLKMNQHELRKGEYSVTMMYRVSSHTRRKQKGSLVDRGANGGMVGDDVKILAHTGQYVDVGGIDGHTVRDLELVSAAGLVDTNVGPRIVILNQYAYLGKGKTIHSSGQLEYYKHEVWDKSSKVGGKQCIITPDGIVLPLSMRAGLPYLDMKVPTDKELEEIPHIHLTADVPWDPSVLDSEYPATEASKHYPEEHRPTNAPFDEVGTLVAQGIDSTSHEDLMVLNHALSSTDIGISHGKDFLLDSLFNNELLQAYLCAYKAYKENYLSPEDEFLSMEPMDLGKGSTPRNLPTLEISAMARRPAWSITPGEQSFTSQDYFF